MSLKEKITEAIEKVNDEIQNTKMRQQNDLSLSDSALLTIRLELEKMSETMDPSKYQPSYPRFLVDLPVMTDLMDFLIYVAYCYKRLKR